MLFRVHEFLDTSNNIIIDSIDFTWNQSALFDNYNKIPCKGVYKKIDSYYIIVFSFNNNVFLIINNLIYSIDSIDFFIEYTKHDENRNSISIYVDSVLDVDISYYEEFKPVDTLFFSEEEEDVNFGLWLSNVLNNIERRNIFRNSW